MLKTVKTTFFVTTLFGVISASFPAPLIAANGKPIGTTADGDNIWVADNSGQKLIRLRASDGIALGVYPVSSPMRVIHDGTNVWAVTRRTDAGGQHQTGPGLNVNRC